MEHRTAISSVSPRPLCIKDFNSRFPETLHIRDRTGRICGRKTIGERLKRLHRLGQGTLNYIVKHGVTARYDSQVRIGILQLAYRVAGTGTEGKDSIFGCLD